MWAKQYPGKFKSKLKEKRVKQSFAPGGAKYFRVKYKSSEGAWKFGQADDWHGQYVPTFETKHEAHAFALRKYSSRPWKIVPSKWPLYRFHTTGERHGGF
jgi:hypothetical protein